MIDWRLSLSMAVIPAFFTLITAVIAFALQSKNQRKRDEWHFQAQTARNEMQTKTQREREDYLKRRQTYCILMGYRRQMMQLLVAYYGANISFAYHNALQTRKISKAVDLQEARTWQHRAIALELEMAKHNYKLFETIGLIQRLFPENTAINDSCKKLNDFKMPGIPKPSDKEKDLQRWYRTNAAKLQQFIQQNYGKLFSDLADLIQDEM